MSAREFKSVNVASNCGGTAPFNINITTTFKITTSIRIGASEWYATMDTNKQLNGLSRFLISSIIRNSRTNVWKIFQEGTYHSITDL